MLSIPSLRKDAAIVITGAGLDGDKSLATLTSAFEISHPSHFKLITILLGGSGRITPVTTVTPDRKD